MAKFYGTLQGSRDTSVTKTGTRYIRTSAQSWDGSVTTELEYDENKNLKISVLVSDKSCTGGETIFQGSLKEFVTKLSK